ncbi:FUSC family protein [Microtetraspora sp. NBRC 16547]|uniref:FUSC family protein n=1 Tax=Microtetraspora sp. NBRC 16547 TaxID=3030993 RepID=UPI0024A09D87|nr:FUSC family protein [Microtetraspora sp. NBRC 16547]GLW98624.1 FUSC family protein [Microtetraspora sp. NBRC 16547]
MREGNHHDTSVRPRTGARVQPLPLKGMLRLRPYGDIWHKPALSVVVATAVPSLVLLVLDRLDLAVYASAGALCALYGHGLPYAARARTLPWVVAGMLAGTGVALLTASLTDSTVIRVAVAALIAAVHRMLCDATRIGPPGNVVLTFVAASCAFIPQPLGDIPGHLAVGLAGGVMALLVCLAPALVRPHGPERVATARALEAAALLRSGAREKGHARAAARHDTAAAVNAAWHTLLLLRPRTAAGFRSRAVLERLVEHAEAALAGDRADHAEAVRLRAWARALRGNGPLPAVEPEPGPHVASRLPAREGPHGFRAVLSELRPGSPLLPIGARVALGCTLAGWGSMAAGVGHPYWAVVTAASVFQANTSLSWQRALQRVLGNLAGLVLFTAILPVSRIGPLALIASMLVCQFLTEAAMTRNYWVGNVFLTPMALLMTEFAVRQPASVLVADRWLDTCVGAGLGILSCLLVTNRRAGGRVECALRRVARAEAAARRLQADPNAGPNADLNADLNADPDADRGADRGADRDGAQDPAGTREEARVRRELAVALVQLREAVDVASGEWWQRALPEEEVALAERDGHRLLAELAAGLPLARAA